MKQNRSVEGYSKLKRSVDMTSSGDENKCKFQIGQDQVSGGVSVICWLTALVANVLLKVLVLGINVKNGNKVQFGNNIKCLINGGFHCI